MSQPIKGLATVEAVIEAMDREARRSEDGLAVLYSDMRAHKNPLRMKVLRAAGWKLAKRLRRSARSAMRRAGAPIDSRRGLPCEACGEPTHWIDFEIDGCTVCGHAASRPRKDGRDARRRACPAGSCRISGGPVRLPPAAVPTRSGGANSRQLVSDGRDGHAWPRPRRDAYMSAGVIIRLRLVGDAVCRPRRRRRARKVGQLERRPGSSTHGRGSECAALLGPDACRPAAADARSCADGDRQAQHQVTPSGRSRDGTGSRRARSAPGRACRGPGRRA